MAVVDRLLSYGEDIKNLGVSKMRKTLIIIGMCLLLLLTGCQYHYNIEIGDFKCDLAYIQCEVLAEKYMIYTTPQGYNITELFGEIQRLSDDS